MELWHDRLASIDCLEKLPGFLKPDTIINLSDWPETFGSGNLEAFKLTTPLMLMNEGRAMRHCVAAYIPDVVAGATTILSVRSEMKRVATAQIKNGRCVQLKGFANQRATARTERFIDEYLEAGLAA